MQRLPALIALPLLLLMSHTAHAAELFGGIYVHDVDTPLTRSGFENGADLQIGWRGGRIGLTPVQPHAFAAINSAGDTHYAAAGVSAKFGNSVYIRPGLGIGVHSGSAGDFHRTDRIAFGSRILFAPELGVGLRVAPRVTAEASWVHLSHAQLFGGQNPGIDNIGVRLNLAL